MVKMLGMVWLAGLAMPAGGWIANQCRQYNRKLHSALVHYAAGLGSGALVSAVALVLVPHGTEHYSPVGFENVLLPPPLTLIYCLGGQEGGELEVQPTKQKESGANLRKGSIRPILRQ